MSENFQGEQFEAISMAIGQLTLAWNDLHENIAHVFWGLVGCSNDTSSRMAIAVWHSSKMDRACRQMLLACLEHIDKTSLANIPTAGDDIKWLLARTDALEEDRNNAVHAPLTSIPEFHSEIPNAAVVSRITYKIGPDTMWGNKRAKKLAEKSDLLAEFRWCRDTALVLRDYANAMADIIITETDGTWPSRPALPNRGHKKPLPNPQSPPQIPK